MGSGVLRAVGDTKRPLYFLILTSILNIVLDLLFVLVFHWGIAGVAYATIIAQFISAGATLGVLLRTRDVYRFSFGAQPFQPVVAQRKNKGKRISNRK